MKIYNFLERGSAEKALKQIENFEVHNSFEVLSDEEYETFDTLLSKVHSKLLEAIKEFDLQQLPQYKDRAISWWNTLSNIERKKIVGFEKDIDLVLDSDIVEFYKNR